MLKPYGLENTNPIIKKSYICSNECVLEKVILVNRDLTLCIQIKFSDMLRGFNGVNYSTKDI